MKPVGARTPGVPLAVALCWLFQSGACLAQDDWRFEGVDRVVAVADIHGAYEAFEHILRRAGLVDGDLRWQGGRAHLVIVGDVLDRGPESRRALDLIRKLEDEAAAAGGRVHFVLGNHEIMNLTGDLRYVSPAEYAAFAAEEPLALRERELERYLEGFEGDAADAHARFEAEYPPGFFAHREAFSPTGQYGAWLLDKPVLLVVNDVAFVHGGLAEGMIERGGDLNDRLRRELEAHLAAYETLVAAGLLSRTADVYDLPSVAAGLLQRSASGDPTLSPELEAVAARLLELDSMTFFSPDGPLWYRGNVSCNRLTERDRLVAALELLGVEQLVVGHTPTEGASVLSRMNETLLRIDTGMLNEHYGGRAAALIIENDERTVIYESEPNPSQPLEQPRRVGSRPAVLSEETLEAVLSRADVSASQALPASATLVTLKDGDLELQAMFTPAESEARNPAVAAYRLDRLLGLDMVPVTVPREIDGVTGALQFWPASSISETERSAGRLEGSAWCPLADQIGDMYVFDALIFNQARTADRIRYSTNNFELLLMGHEVTFSTDRGRPAHLANLRIDLTPAWRAALSVLDEEMLGAMLGDVLDRRRIRALLQRRDRLLDIAR